jgi:hypothetical protein
MTRRTDGRLDGDITTVLETFLDRRNFSRDAEDTDDRLTERTRRQEQHE